MKLDWPTTEEVSVLFEIISYALVTPALYGTERIKNLKKYLDTLFNKVRNFKNVDITTKIIEGRIKNFIEACFLGGWIYAILLLLFYGNRWLEYLILLSFVMLPIVIILIGAFSKRLDKMTFLSVEILLFPAVVLTKALKYILLKIEKFIDSALGLLVRLMQNKEDSAEYPLIILGTIFFLASKLLTLFKPTLSGIITKVATIF